MPCLFEATQTIPSSPWLLGNQAFCGVSAAGNWNTKWRWNFWACNLQPLMMCVRRVSDICLQCACYICRAQIVLFAVFDFSVCSALFLICNILLAFFIFAVLDFSYLEFSISFFSLAVLFFFAEVQFSFRCVFRLQCDSFFLQWFSFICGIPFIFVACLLLAWSVCVYLKWCFLWATVCLCNKPIPSVMFRSQRHPKDLALP